MEEILEARYYKSFSEKFYTLACTFRDENRHLIRMEQNKSLPLMKKKYGEVRRAAQIYKQLLMEKSFFAKQRSQSLYHDIYTEDDFED